MPIYEFRCEHCQKRFEVLAPSTNNLGNVPPACPDCMSRETSRVFSKFAIVGFKHHPEDMENYDEKEDTRLALKDLEDKGKLNKLGKDDIKFYQDYVKCQ